MQSDVTLGAGVTVLSQGQSAQGPRQRQLTLPLCRRQKTRSRFVSASQITIFRTGYFYTRDTTFIICHFVKSVRLDRDDLYFVR